MQNRQKKQESKSDEAFQKPKQNPTYKSISLMRQKLVNMAGGMNIGWEKANVETVEREVNQ